MRLSNARSRTPIMKNVQAQAQQQHQQEQHESAQTRGRGLFISTWSCYLRNFHQTMILLIITIQVFFYLYFVTYKNLENLITTRDSTIEFQTSSNTQATSKSTTTVATTTITMTTSHSTGTATAATTDTATIVSDSSSIRKIRQSIALFYNIYIPHDTDGIVNALRIVQEQMTQIAAARLHMYSSQPIVLRYNTIGKADIITDWWMKDVCVNMTCVHMSHYDEAFEEVTLNDMHQYCLRQQQHQDQQQYRNVDVHANAHAVTNTDLDIDDDDDDDVIDTKVIYLHSKGSYHNRDDKSNDHWRRHLTAAVTHPSCLVHPIANSASTSTCNLCGLQFFPIWAPMMPGNFFVSQCSYVQKLIPPTEFSFTMSRVVRRVKKLGYTHFRASLYYIKQDGAMGDGRFSSEHWIASHPSVRPCDLSTTANYRYWVNASRDVPGEWEFAMAPRPHHDLNASWHSINPVARQVLWTDYEARLREYYLLAGNLYKWLSIYRELPPDDSWIWRWYPDGEVWKGIKDLPWRNRSYAPEYLVDRVIDKALS
jgi:hypothetical protein